MTTSRADQSPRSDRHRTDHADGENPAAVISSDSAAVISSDSVTAIIDDDALMVKVQQHDAHAFQQLVQRYQGVLFGFFYTNSRDRQLAEDLTQETLLKVYDQAWDYLPLGRFRGWLFRMARNLLIDTFRRHSRDALIHAGSGADDDQQALSSVVSGVISPDAHADQRELTGLVDRLLAELPEEQRLTFALHHFAGLSLPEISEILETNLSTTKSRLRLTREKLQAALMQHGIEDPNRPGTPELDDE